MTPFPQVSDISHHYVALAKARSAKPIIRYDGQIAPENPDERTLIEFTAITEPRMPWKKFLSSLLVSGALLTGASSAARADTFDVSIATGHPLTFAWVKQLRETFIPATNKALEGTGHTVTWSENFGGTVSAVGREIDTVGEGLAEIGLGLIIFRAQAQPEQNVGFFAPFSATEAIKVGENMKRLQQTVPALAQSWNASGIEYLGGEFTYDNYQLFTNFPVQTVEDLKGRKIAAAGSAGNWLKGTGAIVVAADLTSYYGSLKDKVVDGVITFGIAAPPPPSFTKSHLT
jgi:TRAP-type C4-dicarboxylate transport system substrate-binding protein